MIRENEFRISKRPYAVDLDSLRVSTTEPDASRNIRVRTHAVRIDAVWFRRRSGVLAAVIGTLWDIVLDPLPSDVHEALARHDDGRYGGAWIGRWDGRSYAAETPGSPDAAAEHMAVLRPMLANYPAVPDGYDGWWRFETRAELNAKRMVSA